MDYQKEHNKMISNFENQIKIYEIDLQKSVQEIKDLIDVVPTVDYYRIGQINEFSINLSKLLDKYNWIKGSIDKINSDIITYTKYAKCENHLFHSKSGSGWESWDQCSLCGFKINYDSGR